MIGPIKNLFQGKSYYLELDESKSVTNEAAAPAPVVEKTPEPVKPIAPAPVVEKKPEPVETIAPTPAVEVEPEPIKAETIKPEKKERKKKAVANTQPTTPAPVSLGVSNPLEIIKAAVQKPTPQAPAKSEENEATFASDYLMYTKTQVKRRPGDCMSSFLDMARQMR